MVELDLIFHLKKKNQSKTLSELEAWAIRVKTIGYCKFFPAKNIFRRNQHVRICRFEKFRSNVFSQLDERCTRMKNMDILSSSGDISQMAYCFVFFRRYSKLLRRLSGQKEMTTRHFRNVAARNDCIDIFSRK